MKFKYFIAGAIVASAVLSIVLVAMLATCSGAETVELQIVEELPAVKTESDTLSRKVVRVIRSGESIFQLFSDMGMDNMTIARYTRELGLYVDISSIQIGDTLSVHFRKNADGVERIIYKPDRITSHILADRGDSLIYHFESIPTVLRRRIVRGTLQGNLNNSLLKLGLTQFEKQQVNNALEAEISFQTDARNGDTFLVLIEERYYRNRKLPRGRVLYTAYNGKRAKFHQAFRYRHKDDDASALNGMYNFAGKTLLQNAVRSPLNSMHVSSPFGNRIHPITGRWKMHTGIDYRASRGTPVYAVANGTVTTAARNGGWGKEVRIRHHDMITQYAHLYKIYVRRGQYVRKGTKIGSVGSTGNSTGSHLHFGLRKKGRWINPKNLRMVGAIKLKGESLAAYKAQRDDLLIELEFMKLREYHSEQIL
ncbi:MAG: M23 family metallopeptidase [Candidatus Cloacimonetes bacterium]|nr:M23 family metallopeptidase [Candidatus Cloacimonadota bacterium]